MLQKLTSIMPAAAWKLQGRPILSFRRLCSLVYFRIKRRSGYDYSFNPPGKSDIPLDLFMPALEKDADMLELAIPSAKKNIWHPIGTIYIIGPEKSTRLRAAATRHRATFIAEEKILPFKKELVNYQVGKLNRDGWIYKMLINLTADTVSHSHYILILDADTCFISPQIFLYNQRPLFNLSNEYHQPYFDANQRLLNLRHRISRSYVTHYMLFDAMVLKRLREDIEKRWNKPWYQAIIDMIDKREKSGFADYEIYGDYYKKNIRPHPILNYWSNVSMTLDSYDELDSLITEARPSFRSISLHNYRTDVIEKKTKTI